jgi:lipopolysaccharide export system permease protein
MRLLDRYLLRELSLPLIYCLAGFLIFWISFDLFSELDEFQKAQMGVREIAQYYVVRTPELLVTVLPVALLLALLYALTHHGRHNELIAMRAAGLSLARISVPYLAVGFLASVALLYLNERLVPDAAMKAEALKAPHVLAAAEQDWVNRVNFRNAHENRIWNIGALNRKTSELIEPHVEWFLPDGTRKQLIAKRAAWTNSGWLFYDVELFSYEPNVDFDKAASHPVRTNVMAMPELQDKPSDIQLQLKFQRMNAIEAAKRTQLSLGEIKYLRDHVELNPRDRALLQTQYHARLAQPWTCLVVALVALPFGARANSRRNVMVGVASSIFIVFSYFVLLRTGLALGTGGYLPAWLAAWLPNVIFATFGLVLTWILK